MFNIFKKKEKKQEPSFWPPLISNERDCKEKEDNGLMAHLADKERYIEIPDGCTYEPPSRLQRIRMWIKENVSLQIK